MQRYASLRQGLVGCWCPSVSGPYGYRLPDLSGYGNHGTLTNMDPPNDWVISGGKGALDFDGLVTENDEVIVATSSTKFALPTLGNRVSVCGWVYNRSFPTYNGLKVQEIWQHGPNNATNGEWYLVQGTSSNPVFQIWQGGPYGANGATTLVINRWYHICGTWDGSFIKVYCNGILDGSASAAISPATLSATTRIGRLGVPGYAYSIDGQLDDIRIYNRALSEQEIRLLASERGIGLKSERQRNRYMIPRNRSSRFLGFPS